MQTYSTDLEVIGDMTGNLIELIGNTFLGTVNVVIDYFTAFYEAIANAVRIIITSLNFVFVSQPLLPSVLATGIMVFLIVAVVRFLAK